MSTTQHQTNHQEEDDSSYVLPLGAYLVLFGVPAMLLATLSNVVLKWAFGVVVSPLEALWGVLALAAVGCLLIYQTPLYRWFRLVKGDRFFILVVYLVACVLLYGFFVLTSWLGVWLLSFVWVPFLWVIFRWKYNERKSLHQQPPSP